MVKLSCIDNTGTVDVSDVIQWALDHNDHVELPSGKFRLSRAPHITRRQRLSGAGSSCTFLIPDGGAGVHVEDCWRNEEERDWATSVDLSRSRSRVQLEGFTVLGNRDIECSGLLFAGRNDDVYVHDVQVLYTSGPGIDVAGMMRESLFSRVVLRGCGNDIASLYVGPGTYGDVTNNITFRDCAVVHPFGPVRIENFRPEPLRRIRFEGMFVHGRTQPAGNFDLVEIVGRVLSVSGNMQLNGSFPGQCAMSFTGPNLQTRPVYVDLRIDGRGHDGGLLNVENCAQSVFSGTAESSSIAGPVARFGDDVRKLVFDVVHLGDKLVFDTQRARDNVDLRFVSA